MSNPTVAPADEPYAGISKPIEEKQDTGESPVHPAVGNPDQPTFPAPVGVSRQDLEDSGVAHVYMPGSGDVVETPVPDPTGGDGE